MTEREKLYEQMYKLYMEYSNRIKEIDRELELYDGKNSTIVIKTINGNPYYYEQWREGDKIKCNSLGRVSPGVISAHEKELARKRNLAAEKEELMYLCDEVKRSYDKYRSVRMKDIVDDYNFEVYYKNDISARVSVRGPRVFVKRLITHPVRQLFYSDRINRNQLGEIFRLRCFDENRYDAQDKLKALGLTDYDPQLIVRKTHGVSYNDHLWFRFEGENLKAEDVLVRR